MMTRSAYRSLSALVFYAGLSACLLVANGCSQQGERPDAAGDAAAAGDETLRIAVIPKSVGGDFWETVEAGATAARDDLGIEMRWEGPLAETEIAEQNKIIENMVNLGVDGIALAPLNSRAQRKSVQSAVDAGIPVVVFDSAVEGDAHVSFVATDNEAGGVLAGEYLAEHLQPGARILVLRYLQGSASNEARVRGCINVLSEAGLEVEADPYPENGTVAGSKKTATNVLEGFVKNGKLELDGAFACNLNTALGLAEALEDLRKSGVETDLTFVGFDSSPMLLEKLQADELQALVVQNPRKMGRLAVETLVEHLRGATVEPLIHTEAQVVTAERLKNEPAIRRLVGLE